jgi:hypothetical protein
MNFFCEKPDDRFFDVEEVRRTLETEYYPIQDEPLLGDVITLSKSGGAMVHAAVYIADDVVFTKNGDHFSQPWLLMKLDDMAARYASDPPLLMRVHRLKRL